MKIHFYIVYNIFFMCVPIVKIFRIVEVILRLDNFIYQYTFIILSIP